MEGKSDLQPTRVPLPGQGASKSCHEHLGLNQPPQGTPAIEDLSAAEIQNLVQELRSMSLEQLREGSINIHAQWKRSRLPLRDDIVHTMLFQKWWSNEASLDPVALMERYEMLSWAGLWVDGAMPTIQLTHGAAAALALTDCSGVQGSEINFPFPNFLLQLPSPGGPILFEDYDGTVVEGRWATVHTWRSIHGKARAMEFDREFYALSEEYRLYARQGMTNAPTRWSEAIEDLIKRTTLTDELVFRVWSAEGVSVHLRVWPLQPGESVEKWIELADDASKDLTNRQDVSNMPLTSVDRKSLQALTRIVVNLCLYLDGNREPGEPKQGVPRAFPPKSTKGEYGPMSWVVGKDLVLPHVLREAARDYSRRGKLPTQWRVTKRFVVRGHWRWQACGQGRKERRRRWIAPFWKGPERGEGLMRNIRVNA